MLPLQFLESLAFLLVLCLGGVRAAYPYTEPEFCVQGCYQALAALKFRDYDAKQTYVGMRCHSRLVVSSIYACYNLRCSDKFTFQESFGHLTDFCEEYGYTTLNGTYEDVIQDLIVEYGSIENVPVFDPTKVKGTVNNTVMSSQEYYDLSYKTLVSMLDCRTYSC